MAVTIYEPTLSRAEAAPVIEQALRAIYQDVRDQAGPVQRAVLGDLKLWFRPTHAGVYFGVYQPDSRVLGGYLDPAQGLSRSYSNDRFDPYHWVRGRWEEHFGVPVRTYDPHWDDEISVVLRKAIRKAASSPGSRAAKQVVELMISYADGRFEDVIELTVDGGEDAAVYAGWVVNSMLGPNMAAMVPLMMWVHGAAPVHVLKAYDEAHQKQGVRRRHVREILGTSQRVAEFFAYITGLNQMERLIEVLRASLADEVSTLLAKLAQDTDPIIDQVFPGGVVTYLQRFLTNPNLKVRWSLSRRRSGLFS